MKERGLFVLIYIMTVFDVFLTRIGLEAGIIQEANPVMNYFMGISIDITMIGVLAGVALCLYVIFRLRNRIMWIQSIMIGVAGIKLLICLLHVRWVMFYIL